MYDDNGNLVRLRLDDDDDDDDGEDETGQLENFVFFFLYTRRNPIDSKPLYIDDEDALKRSDFDPALPTRFVTHGWMNSRGSAACTLIRDGMCVLSNNSVKLFHHIVSLGDVSVSIKMRTYLRQRRICFLL